MAYVKQLLPIGSVVSLKKIKKRVMIYGIKQTKNNDDKHVVEYDYIGVLYPEGNMGSEFQVLFNHDDILEVSATGYTDSEHMQFIALLETMYEKGLMDK